MNKKGQSISINTIIIAAIALAVLVVLFVIFTGRLGIFSKGVGEATNCDQACKSAGYKQATNSVGPDDAGNYGDCRGSNKLVGYFATENGVRVQCCCV
ncbi:hypothetical protein HYX00_05500 [Candidatus Woesearchaeota archaeon]|nr:hypothetical protein [Candidatus Woesearchaeota archaeon]